MNAVAHAGLISVAIASMGRPSLRATLESLSATRIPDGYALEIIVADDSPDGAAARIVRESAVNLPVRLVPVAAHNVSTARNASIETASGEWLAFVDDDETVDVDWLTGLVETAQAHAADGVFGPVRHRYPADTPDWFKKADPMFFDQRWAEVGRVVPTGHTANALIRRSALDDGNLRFDAGFGVSGGEDDDLFRRMSATGAKFVVTDTALVFEDVPAARTNVAYIIRRSIRGGQTFGKIVLRDRRGLERVAFALVALAKLVAMGVGALIVRPFNRASAFRMRTRMAANWGKLLALTSAPLKSSWS